MASKRDSGSNGSEENGRVGIAAEAKKTAGFLSDVRTIVALIASVVVGVFIGGIYFGEARREVGAALELVKQHEEKLKQIEPKLQVLSKLAKWSPVSKEGARTGLNGGTSYNPTLCPDGHYAVGIRSWGAPGATRYCVGCLVAVQVICKPLPLN